jgi:chromate transporter
MRASALHIGAAAASAALREELTGDRRVTTADFDAAYAVARLTPGTNLLALYALMGHRLGGWVVAVQAVAVGSLIPALVALIIAIAYSYSASPLVAALMRGARAGGLAVFLGAVVRLLRPQLTGHVRLGLLFAVAAFVAVWWLAANQLTVLLLAAAVGAVALRPRA